MKNTSKNIYKLFIAVILAMPLFLQSCGDCDLVGTTYPCRVREGTIPQFDPRLQINPVDNSVTIVPTYNNQTFSFPNDNSSSGTLTNDNRYETETFLDQFVVIDQRTFVATNGQTMKVQLVNTFPPNHIMVGDAMVISVSSAFDYAILRFFGSVAKFPQQFNYEDAYRFCNEYLPAYKTITGDEEFTQIASQASIYGSAIRYIDPNPVQNDIRVVNPANQDVTAQFLSEVPQTLIDELGTNKQVDGVDVQVRIGDVYYYRARNGKEFAVIISNIFEGSLDPNIRRVTVRFSELKGKGATECKTD